MAMHFQKIPYTRGLEKIDRAFGRPGVKELIILYGLSGMGKTEFSYFVARSNAEIGNKVCYIQLELDKDGMITRIVTKRMGLDKLDYQNMAFDEERQCKMESLYEAIENMENLEILSPDDKGAGNIMHMVRDALDRGYKMIFIDNLDKIIASGSDDENARYKKITSELQDIKNENNATIILIHHAKKAGGKNDIGPTGPSGLRGSQKITDNSTQVIEIYRDTDPTETDMMTKSKVVLSQTKDTFYGGGNYCEIFFKKGDYIPEWIDIGKPF